MKNARILLLTSMMIVLLGLQSLAVAQEPACPALVQQALNLVGSACDGLGRNQVCYGNKRVTAMASPQDILTGFANPGDKVQISDIIDLQTVPLNSKDNVWGVAMLALQANLPDTLPGQKVLFVVFGETELHSEIQAAGAALTLSAAAKGSANVRSGPGKNYAVAGTLTTGQAVQVTGRSNGGDWLRLNMGTEVGWVSAALVTVDGSIQTLPVVEQGQPADSYTAPMQAFRLKTGTGEPACAEAPRDGLLIQAPKAAKVNFLINGIEVHISSTVLLTAPTSRQLTVTTLEGSVTVTSGGSSQTVAPWTAVDANEGQPPGALRLLKLSDMQPLPVRLFPQPVTIPPASASVRPSAGITPQPGGEATETPSSGGGGVTLIVPGAYGWLDSGVALRAGQDFTITAAGTMDGWNVCSTDQPTSCETLRVNNCSFICAHTVNGPDGGAGTITEIFPGAEGLFPMPDAQAWALLGRVGKGKPFQVGSGGTFKASTNGTLQFTVNDAEAADPNLGEFIVTVDVPA
jgi:hypothetical protein